MTQLDAHETAKKLTDTQAAVLIYAAVRKDAGRGFVRSKGPGPRERRDVRSIHALARLGLVELVDRDVEGVTAGWVTERGYTLLEDIGEIRKTAGGYEQTPPPGYEYGPTGALVKVAHSLGLRHGKVYHRQVDSGWRLAPRPTTGRWVLKDPDGQTVAAGYPDPASVLRSCGRLIVREMGSRGLGWGE